MQAKSVSDNRQRPFNARLCSRRRYTALLLNNPNNNLENFDKCPVACGYATKVSKVTHSLLAIRSQSTPLFKGKCQSRVNTLMHNEISDHLFFAGKQERYAMLNIAEIPLQTFFFLLILRISIVYFSQFEKVLLKHQLSN